MRKITAGLFILARRRRGGARPVALSRTSTRRWARPSTPRSAPPTRCSSGARPTTASPGRGPSEAAGEEDAGFASSATSASSSRRTRSSTSPGGTPSSSRRPRRGRDRPEEPAGRQHRAERLGLGRPAAAGGRSPRRAAPARASDRRRKGMRLFDEGETPVPLKLISSETFETGVLNLVYAPASRRAKRPTRTPRPTCPSRSSRAAEPWSAWSRRTASSSARSRSATLPTRRSSSSWGRAGRCSGGRRASPAARRLRPVRDPLRPPRHRPIGHLRAGYPEYTGADLVADAAGVLEAYGISAAHVVGVSAGGAFAQLLALDFPATSSRSSSSARLPRRPVSAAFRRHRALRAVPHERGGGLVATRVGDRVPRRLRAHARGRPAPVRRAGGQRARPPRRRARERHRGLREPRADRGRRAAARAVVLDRRADARDPRRRGSAFPLEHGQALAAEIADARLLTLEGAGHGVDRADWEVIVRAIEEHTPRRLGAEPAAGRSAPGFNQLIRLRIHQTEKASRARAIAANVVASIAWKSQKRLSGWYVACA